MQATKPIRQPRSVTMKAAAPSVSANHVTRVTITETCQIAATCRTKLGKEAVRSDLHLRRLVCHANMLDEIMVQLSQTEQEYQAFLDSKTCVAPVPHKHPPRLQWMDTISEEPDDPAEDRDGAFECSLTNTECNTLESKNGSARPTYGTLGSKTRSPPPRPWSNYFDDIDDSDEEEDEDDDGAVDDDEEEGDDDLSLRRVPTCHRVPELVYDVDSASDEEEAPLPLAAISYLSCEKGPCSPIKVVLQGNLKAGKSAVSPQLLVVVKTGS